MYKDRGKQKEANKEASQRRRDKVKGMTGKGMTAGIRGGMTLHLDNVEPWYPNKQTDGKGRVIDPVILSDGQKWYPRPGKGGTTGLPDHILRDISIAVKAYGHIKGQPSLKERIRKALEYQEWAKGQPRPGVLRDKVEVAL